MVSAEEAKARKLPIVAPSGFMEEATSENILMGPAMGRRAMYMYGSNLPKSPTGLVDNGLGKAVAFGKLGILQPNITVESEENTCSLMAFVLFFTTYRAARRPRSLFSIYLTLKRFAALKSWATLCTTFIPCAVPRCEMLPSGLLI